VRNAQVSPGDVRLEAGELAAALARFADKYPGDDASQLGAAADWFVGAFKQCELAFNKAVADGPVEKARPLCLAVWEPLVGTTQAGSSHQASSAGALSPGGGGAVPRTAL
jgi:hypothetical protein